MPNRATRTALIAALAFAPLTAAPSGAAPPHVAFVTTVSGTGNLGTWPNAGGKSGLAAADAVCQARAAAGGLPNSASFVAWLSDSNNDAWCRVHGYGGKKSAKCGEVSLPTGAGPWVRVDGYPWAATIGEIAAVQKVYTPLSVTELGGTVVDGFAWTGTKIDGTVDTTGATTCSDWTSGAAAGTGARSGSTSATGNTWTTSNVQTCSSAERLLCLEKGSGALLPDFAQSGRPAFLSSATGNALLSSWLDAGGQGGLAAGDAICRAAAAASGVPHAPSFKAWLSTSTTDAVSRLSGTGTWVRLDGVPIATSKSDLIDGALFAPLNLTDDGEYIGYYGVWTGTNTSGQFDGTSCGDWTNPGSGISGTNGLADVATAGWTDPTFTTPCNYGVGRLYCLSDTATINAPVVPIPVGGAVNLTGNAITQGSKLKVFVATSSGPVDVTPDGVSPTNVTSTTWSGTLPWPWPVGGANAKLLGNGFMSLQLVQTDLGYNSTDPVGDILTGSASLGVPSVTTIGGVLLSSTSFQLSIGTANVQGLVARGSPLTIAGSGFASPVVNVFTASGNVGPLTPTTSTSTSITVDIPANAPIGPGSFQVVNTTDFQPSNAVSIPIGELITVGNVAVNGDTVTVTGTGFNPLTVINLFAAKSGVLTNVGGFGNGQTPNVPLTVQDSHQFTFTRPAGLDAGPAYLQAINPPFIPYTTSASGGGFTLP